MAPETIEHKVNYIHDKQENINIFEEENTIYSVVNTTLNSESTNQNITLLNYNNYIKASGSTINNDLRFNVDFNLLSPNTSYKIYGHPKKWIFDEIQQFNNCGVESSMNILSINHKLEITDQTLFELNFTYQALGNNLCRDKNANGVLEEEDGENTAQDRQEILRQYGVASSVVGCVVLTHRY